MRAFGKAKMFRNMLERGPDLPVSAELAEQVIKESGLVLVAQSEEDRIHNVYRGRDLLKVLDEHMHGKQAAAKHWATEKREAWDRQAVIERVCGVGRSKGC